MGTFSSDGSEGSEGKENSSDGKELSSDGSEICESKCYDEFYNCNFANALDVIFKF